MPINLTTEQAKELEETKVFIRNVLDSIKMTRAKFELILVNHHCKFILFPRRFAEKLSIPYSQACSLSDIKRQFEKIKNN